MAKKNMSNGGQISYSMGHKILCHLREVDRLVAGKPQSFVTCEIDPTNICQQECSWCIYKEVNNTKAKLLDISKYQEILEQLAKYGCKSITLTGGGEPLMHPKIEWMIDYAHQCGFRVGLITNGVDLQKIALQLCKLDFVRVSLDCATSETYQALKKRPFFDRVYQNIRLAVSVSNLHVGLSMVYSDVNKHEIENFVHLGKLLGVDYTQVKAAWMEDNIESRTKGMMKAKGAFITERYSVKSTRKPSKRFLACVIAGLCGQVAADGNFYYCCVHRGKEEFKIGNLNGYDIKDLLNIRKKMIIDFSECGSCRYMNYVKVYREVKDNKYIPLRHREFI